ncbi:MAG: FAD-dependent oxidoreductase [Pseudomonadota bacterium]
MTKKIIIVGAGIIGAAIAYHLRDAEVTVVDAGAVASGASGRSFGWINASFYADEAHHALRRVGITAWRELGMAVNWSGCLLWEGDLTAQEDHLTALGYPVQRLPRAEISALEPAVAAPAEALLLPDEGAVDAGQVAQTLLSKSGAKVVLGCPVEALVTKYDRVTGVRIAQGEIAADQVIMAAGTGAEGLLADIGVALPMARRPATLVRSAPIAPLLKHVLVGPMGEVRQSPDGRLVVPAAIGHQGAQDDGVCRPDLVADATIDRLAALLPGIPLRWEEVVQAMRPVPADGLPVIGAPREGLYVAVMHSGVTLAALTGRLVAAELAGRLSNMLGPYRPDRFQA